MVEPPNDPVQSRLESGDKRNLVDIVLVPPHVEPVLIGTNGMTIQRIQRNFHVKMLFLGPNNQKYPLRRELHIEARTELELLKAKQYVLDEFINAKQLPLEAISKMAYCRKSIPVPDKNVMANTGIYPTPQSASTVLEQESTVLFAHMKGDEMYWVFYDWNSKSFFRQCSDKKNSSSFVEYEGAISWFKIQYKNQSTQSTIAITSIRAIGANVNLPQVNPEDEVWAKILNCRGEIRLKIEDVKKQEFINVTPPPKAQKEVAITEKAADNKKLTLCWKKTETCAFFALYKNGQFGNRFKWPFGKSCDVCVGTWYQIEFEREPENSQLIKMLCNPVVEDQPDPAAQTLVMNGAIRFVLNVNRSEDNPTKCTSECGRVWNVPTDIVVPAQFAVWCQMLKKGKECNDSDFVFVRLAQEESVE